MIAREHIQRASSDAIAGVINIITRKDDHGGDFSAGSGAFYTGQGFNWSARAGRGFKIGDGGHLYVTAEADSRERTYQGWASSSSPTWTRPFWSRIISASPPASPMPSIAGPTRLTGPLTSATAVYSYTEDGPITSDGGSYVLGFALNW